MAGFNGVPAKDRRLQATEMKEGGSPLLLVHCTDDLVTGRRLKMATTAKTRSDSEATSDRRRLEKEEEEGGERRREGSWKWWSHGEEEDEVRSVQG